MANMFIFTCEVVSSVAVSLRTKLWTLGPIGVKPSVPLQRLRNSGCIVKNKTVDPGPYRPEAECSVATYQGQWLYVDPGPYRPEAECSVATYRGQWMYVDPGPYRPEAECSAATSQGQWLYR
jgi:lipocalin